MIPTHFSTLDWVIVVTYLAATLATGLYGRKFVGGIADFLVAGRELGTFLAVATLAATEIGTITFMYYAELGYKTGYASFVNGLIAGLVMIFLGRTGFIVKRLRAMRLMTVPEFFEVKFSRNLRVFVGILVATGGILNMGVFLKVEGTFLAIISGVSLSHIKAVMTGILLLELVYTVLGGMVSIVITDFIQFVALGWAYVAFQVLIWLAVHTCWQTTAMRTFSTRSPEISKRVFSWAGFIYLGRGMMPMMWGIAALALLGPSQNSLEAMPRMLATILPSGVLGLVVAGMLAATMSVNSSYLLGWSAIIAQDIIGPLRKKPLTSLQQVMLNRGANLFVSLFVMVWGLWYTMPGSTYFYLNMTATIYLSGTLVAVIAGLFWSRASTLGGYLAMAGGAIATIGFFFFKAPASYAGAGAFALAGIGMVVGSLLSERKRARAFIS
jgi:SSS family solute:Na+ symporter